MLTGPSPASLPLGTLSPKGRGDAWARAGDLGRDISAPSSPRPFGERVPEGRVRGQNPPPASLARARMLRRNGRGKTTDKARKD